ncbi:MAG: M28 family metallopeptidase [Planctomycetota bacterium]
MTLAAPLLALAVAAQVSPTSPQIRAADFARHVQRLSSDAFEGRGPGTAGEVKTVGYLVEQFSAFGLEPGGDVVDGERTWTQAVPMVELTPKGAPVVAATAASEDASLLFGRDVMVWSPVVEGAVSVDASEVVFAGYGIVAPEYEWDDYAGLDVRGKTVVVLVNDPGYATGDPELFRGRTMTYYGRWTYKFEEASRQGAAACLIVHEEGAAGYDWTVVLQSWGRPQLVLDAAADETPTEVEGWISRPAARALFTAAGRDLDQLSVRALERGAEPVALDATFSAQVDNAVRRIESDNVVARVTGRSRPDEAVLVCAHWDHLGVREGAANEDNVYNGAFDNATGIAAMLEIAEAIAAQDPAPERTVLFLATTAEEKGLLGSAFYASDPLVPLAKTVCGLNIDGVNTMGPLQDIAIVGYGASELDDDLRAVAAAQGRTVVPESSPEKGYYFRSDHFSLAKVGVPMLYTDDGTVGVERGEEWVRTQKERFLKDRYHRVTDEFDPEWDLRGAELDVRLFHALVRLWSSMPDVREWSPDSEFRAAREASLRGAAASGGGR